MANTGIKTVLTLKEINASTGLPTGLTKPNVPGDTDYIAPTTDLTACPVSYNAACPVILATGQVGQIEFEFSLANAVVNNPALKKVNVIATAGATVRNIVFTFPNTPPNYFHGIFGFLPGATTFTLSSQYLDASDNVVTTCPNLATVTTL